jgi:hypothetical protein
MSSMFKQKKPYDHSLNMELDLQRGRHWVSQNRRHLFAPACDETHPLSILIAVTVQTQLCLCWKILSYSMTTTFAVFLKSFIYGWMNLNRPEACRKTHPITTRNNVQQHTLCLFLSEVGTIIPPKNKIEKKSRRKSVKLRFKGLAWKKKE